MQVLVDKHTAAGKMHKQRHRPRSKPPSGPAVSLYILQYRLCKYSLLDERARLGVIVGKTVQADRG